MRLTHTRLLVDDFEASMRFFQDTLALGVALEVEGIYAEFDTGSDARDLQPKLDG